MPKTCTYLMVGANIFLSSQARLHLGAGFEEPSQALTCTDVKMYQWGGSCYYHHVNQSVRQDQLEVLLRTGMN